MSCILTYGHRDTRFGPGPRREARAVESRAWFGYADTHGHAELAQRALIAVSAPEDACGIAGGGGARRAAAAAAMGAAAAPGWGAGAAERDARVAPALPLAAGRAAAARAAACAAAAFAGHAAGLSGAPLFFVLDPVAELDICFGAGGWCSVL